MEAPDNGMHFVDAGHRLRLPDSVDDAAMAAGNQYEAISARYPSSTRK
jgi:hypothetical protein